MRLSAYRFPGQRTGLLPEGRFAKGTRTFVMSGTAAAGKRGRNRPIYMVRRPARMPLLRQGLQARRRVEARTAYAAADAVGAQGQIQGRREDVGSRPFVVQPGQ